MSKDKIHFKNEPFMAHVAGKGNERVQCVPIVYDELTSCGLGILFRDGTAQVWGMMSPRNLIAAWRGTEVLRRLDTVENGTLCAAYYTGSRDPHGTDIKSHVEPTVAKIGQKVYKEIMSMAVPEKIIRAILDNQKNKDDIAPNLDPITDEVRAGTIQWRQEFADAGIKHPDEIDAKERMQKKIIAEFERLLSSYAANKGMSRHCMGMSHVESAVLALVKKDANKTYSNEVIMALAGVVGELSISEFSMFMIPIRSSRKQYDSHMDETKEKALDNSAEWLASYSNRPHIFFWKRPQKSFTHDSAKELLQQLLEEYFPLKKPESLPA